MPESKSCFIVLAKATKQFCINGIVNSFNGNICLLVTFESILERKLLGLGSPA